MQHPFPADDGSACGEEELAAASLGSIADSSGQPWWPWAEALRWHDDAEPIHSSTSCHLHASHHLLELHSAFGIRMGATIATLDGPVTRGQPCNQGRASASHD